ncbi:MAG: hypothetical protein ACWA5R_05475 [bacterium]
MKSKQDFFASSFKEQWNFLKKNAANFTKIDSRTSDLLKPMFEYNKGSVELFDQTNMCLLAKSNTLLLNEKIFSDIYDFFEDKSNAHLGISWFWMHQMVHITQGLSYKSFRELNKNTDRAETMRADCWADFISIKTLAISQLIKSGNEQPSKAQIQSEISKMLSDIVLPMTKMNPNIFIPFRREIELKRIISLIVMDVIVKRLDLVKSEFLIDDSIFVNWQRDFSQLYIWYGQTNLLGRDSINIATRDLDDIVYSLRYSDFDKAYGIINALPLPEVSKLELELNLPWAK